ncbi:MAG: Mg2+ and Co2+ transporter CorB [Clostridia bacterium]
MSKNKNRTSKKDHGKKWILFLFISSFFIAAFLILISTKIMESLNIYLAVVVILIIIFIGILFDTIGMAVAVADISVFHSKASHKLFGAQKAIWLIRHVDKVTSICNDVVGDICGIISGAASTMVVFYVAGTFDNSGRSWANLVISGAVASLTIGGKAIGKRIALNKKNDIVYKTGIILQVFSGRDRPNAKDSKKIDR